MFGPEDGSAMAAVDYEDQGMLFDLVAGANNAPLPPAAYLLRTRDLAAECPLMIDVVDTTEAPHAAFWGDFDQRKRIRAVFAASCAASIDGSPMVAIGTRGENAAHALRAAADTLHS